MSDKKAVPSQRWPRNACYISGVDRMICCIDMAIRNYPRWRRASNLDWM